MRTAEQLNAFDLFRKVVEPLRLRVEADGESFPVVRGQHGQIEWYCDGVDCHSCPLPGRFALAVHTTGRLTRQKILGVPGVTPHQRGDFELRALFLPAALAAVAKVIRARRRRSLSAAHRAAALAGLERARAARRADVGGLSGMVRA
jgi:hypothetical protein